MNAPHERVADTPAMCYDRSFELSWPAWLETMFHVEETSSSVAGSVFNVECILSHSADFPVFFQAIALYTFTPLFLFAGAALFWFCVHPRLYKKHEVEYNRCVSDHAASHVTLATGGAASEAKAVEVELAKLRRHWAAHPKQHRQDRFIVTCVVIFFLLQVRGCRGRCLPKQASGRALGLTAWRAPACPSPRWVLRPRW